MRPGCVARTHLLTNVERGGGTLGTWWTSSANVGQGADTTLLSDLVSCMEAFEGESHTLVPL